MWRMGAGVPRNVVLRIRSDRYLIPTVSPGHGRDDSGNGTQLQQSVHQRRRRLVALGLPSIAHCPQTLAQDGVRGRITDVATDRFSLHTQRFIAISGAFVHEELRVSSGGQHG